MVRCLIIGESGQLAQALTECAWPEGWQVMRRGRACLNLMDLSSLSDRIAEEKPDLILNAAAYTSVDKAEVESELADILNHQAVALLGGYAQRANVPVIHYSTDYVFDGKKDGPYREEDAIAPLNVYGRTKAKGEDALRKSGCAHAILRTSWVYHHKGSNFVLKMLSLADKAELKIVMDQVGAPSYARDLAQGTIALAQQMMARKEKAFGTFHFTANGAVSWYGFAEAIFEIASGFGWAVPRLEPILASAYPMAARRPENSRLDCGKIARDCGIVLPPWQDGLQRCLNKIFEGQG